MPDLGAIAIAAGMIVAGASGAQLIDSPKAWPSTIEGFGQRVADRTGYFGVLRNRRCRRIDRTGTRQHGYGVDGGLFLD